MNHHIAAAELGQAMLRALLVGRADPGAPAPFEGVKTKPDDLWSVALLQGWAEVIDILSFYQQRILEEGYIDTAVQPVSRRLLHAQLGLERGHRTALAGAPKPGAPVPIVLDPGCAATADFIIGLRTAPGLPPVTVLPAGAQLRRHAVDAPGVMIFEAETAVGLRAEWADLPLLGPLPRAVPSVAAGAPGLLTNLRDGAPGPGDRLLLVDHANPAVWQRRTVTISTPNAKAATCEVSLNTPLTVAMSAPFVLDYARRAPLFGWNAPDFGTQPPAVRLAAIKGIENTLRGGVSMLSPTPAKLNIGLSAAAPRALAMGPDGTVYMASDDGLSWSPGGKGAWQRAPGSAAVRDIGLLAIAPDGLVMLAGASGNVWVGRNPAAGFEALLGGYVLEPSSMPFKAATPVKATLPGGPARALFAVGDPTSRILAQTHAGLFEYDPKGFWLSVTAADWGLKILAHFDPIQTRLNGKRLAACVVSADREFGILAYGLNVEIVRLGEAVAPPPPVAGATAATPPKPLQVPPPSPPAPTSSPPAPTAATAARPGWFARLVAWFEGLFKPHKPPAPSPSPKPPAPPQPHRAKHSHSRWVFDDPVIALAPVTTSASHGWDSFLAADANGVYRIDWDKAPVRADDGLPLGPVERFVVEHGAGGYVVRVAMPAGVFRFEPATSTWVQEYAAQTAGPVAAAAANGRLAVAEPLAFPAEWPGFELASKTTSIDLSAQGVELAPGETIVLSSATGAVLPATVVSATPLALEGFGLRERVLRVAFTPQGDDDTADFSRRTTTVDIGGRAVALVSPPDIGGEVVGPGAAFALRGDWTDLGAAAEAEAAPVAPASGVAGAAARALPPNMGAVQTWGAQPIDMSGVAAKASAPVPEATEGARIAVTGPSASILPKPLGGVASFAGAASARDLAGCAVRALTLVRSGLMAATAGDGVFLQAGGRGAWAAANTGLTGPAARETTALATVGAGSVQTAWLATADGIYRNGPDDGGWVRQAAPPPTVATALCVPPSGVVVVGGAGGVFASTATGWVPALGGVMPTPVAITALAAWKAGALAAPASGGVLFAGADNVWRVWSEAMATARVAAILPVGDSVYLASDAGLYVADANGAARRLLDIACNAVDAVGSTIAVTVVGEGVRLSSDGGATWEKRPAGLANDLTAIALVSATDVRAGAGLALHLAGGGGLATWRPAPAAAIAPATFADSLDAGLARPLTAALPPAVAKSLPDGATVSVVDAGSLWTLGPPGKGLGQGAALLSLQADGIALTLPTEVFVVEAAGGASPLSLTLSGVSAQGVVDAWPDDLIFVPTDQPPVTLVRSITGVLVKPDLASTIVALDQPLGVLLDSAQSRCTANVVTGSQGETVAGEILGDGNAGGGFQTFELRRSPLTFVQGDDGVSRPVLRVFVNGVGWTPVATLVGAGPSDRVYTLKVDSTQRGQITFGDGVTGARLPNGRGNVTATYRTGMAPMQSMDPSVITLLMSRPSVGGVRGVIRNPGRAPIGGTAQARAVRANLRSVGRLVTADNYVQFLETFTQVGSAVADEIEVRSRPLIYLTVALADGKTPEEAGFSLDQAARAVAAAQAIPAPPFQIGLAARRRVRIEARLWVEAGAVADKVESDARNALTALLGPANPAIGRARRLTEIEDLLQRVAGVAGVEVQAFYRAGRARRADVCIDASRAKRSAAGLLTPAEVLVLDGADDAVVLTLLPVGSAA